MTGRTRALWAGLLVAVVALVGACGEDGDDSSASTSTSATETTAAATSSTAGDTCVPQASADPVSGAAESEFALFTDVRSAGHPCVDRVTFEFQGTGQPGYQVGYEAGPIVQDGSGEPVAVEGNAFLVVRLSPASGFDSGTSTSTYNGPGVVEPSGANFVTQVVRTGDFEGTLTWVVGLDQQRPFSVSRLQDPSRVYIDIG